MSCEKLRKFISPYLDSELDAKTSMEIEEHLESCPACQKFFEEELHFEKSLKKQLTSDAATDIAWEKALKNTVAKPRFVTRVVQYATFVLVLGLVFSGGWFRFAMAGQDLARTAVKSHNKYLADDLQLSIQSSDPEEIEQFFNDKLAFKVKVPKDPPMEDCQLVGARICHLKEAPVAYLVYHIDNEPVSLFLINEEDAVEFKQIAKDQDKGEDMMQRHAMGDKKVVTCKTPNGVVCALGSVPTETLEKLAYNYENL